MAGKVTARDVARVAGVSQPTVSRVFTGSAYVDPTSAERVRAAARELGYVPNFVARSLISGSTRRIGIVVAHLSNGFFSTALQALSEAFNREGYSVAVYFAANSAKDVEDIVEKLLADRVDGIVFASVNMTNNIVERVRKLGIGCLLFNRAQATRDVSMVTVANREGARQATDYLIRSGHQRIAHIAGWQEAQNGVERRRGFDDAMQTAGLIPFASPDCHFRRHIAMDEVRRMFQSKDVPDALFVANDHMAFGVLEVLRYELGLRVPHDVSVIGFGDTPMASWKIFDLTTFHQPLAQMVEAAVQTLLGEVNDKNSTPKLVELPGELVIRSTAKRPSVLKQ